MARLLKSMKPRRGFVGFFPFLAHGLVVLAVGTTGYWCGFRTSARALRVSAGDIAAADYFRERLSFSEINDVEAQVRASALRLITELRDRRADSVIPFGWSSATGRALRRSELDSSRVALEEILGRTFEADSRELLVKELLFVLKQLDDDGRWLSVYLDSLYRHPARELTGLMAANAVRAGVATGREHEVLAAFQHVLDIPMDLAVKDQLRAAAAQLTPIATSFANDNAGSM
jgi:hypothetical protein